MTPSLSAEAAPPEAPPRAALGKAYWTLLVLVLLDLAVLLAAPYTLFGGNLRDLWGFSLGVVTAGLWLGASAAWGRDRNRQILALAPEAAGRAVRNVRLWCWGTLAVVGLASALVTSAPVIFLCFYGGG